MLTYYAFRVAFLILPRLPRQPVLRVAASIGRLAARVAPSRRVVRDNLCHVVGDRVSAGVLESLVREVFANQARNYVDMLYVPRMSKEEIAGLVNLDELIGHMEVGREGRGLIVAIPHMGNLEVAAQALALRGLDTLTVVEHLEPEPLHAFVLKLRAWHGWRMVVADADPRRLYRHLERGGILLLAADRDVSGGGVPAAFFGATALLPDGYARLVRRTGSRVAVANSLRRPDQTFVASGCAIDDVDPDADPDRVVDEIMSRVLAVMERVIARNPEQWVMFQPLWEPSKPQND